MTSRLNQENQVAAKVDSGSVALGAPSLTSRVLDALKVPVILLAGVAANNVLVEIRNSQAQSKSIGELNATAVQDRGHGVVVSSVGELTYLGERKISHAPSVHPSHMQPGTMVYAPGYEETVPWYQLKSAEQTIPVISSKVRFSTIRDAWASDAITEKVRSGEAVKVEILGTLTVRDGHRLIEFDKLVEPENGKERDLSE